MLYRLEDTAEIQKCWVIFWGTAIKPEMDWTFMFASLTYTDLKFDEVVSWSNSCRTWNSATNYKGMGPKTRSFLLHFKGQNGDISCILHLFKIGTLYSTGFKLQCYLALVLGFTHTDVVVICLRAKMTKICTWKSKKLMWILKKPYINRSIIN